jgi:hypothetical protein
VGVAQFGSVVPHSTPLPNPPPQGGREHTEFAAGEHTEFAAGEHTEFAAREHTEFAAGEHTEFAARADPISPTSALEVVPWFRN